VSAAFNEARQVLVVTASNNRNAVFGELSTTTRTTTSFNSGSVSNVLLFDIDFDTQGRLWGVGCRYRRSGNSYYIDYQTEGCRTAFRFNAQYSVVEERLINGARLPVDTQSGTEHVVHSLAFDSSNVMHIAAYNADRGNRAPTSRALYVCFRCKLSLIFAVSHSHANRFTLQPGNNNVFDATMVQDLGENVVALRGMTFVPRNTSACFAEPAVDDDELAALKLRLPDTTYTRLCKRLCFI
jgi:hypothetical protein